MKEILIVSLGIAVVMFATDIPTRTQQNPEVTLGTIYGAGSDSCGEWTTDQQLRHAFMEWIEGYVTGLDSMRALLQLTPLRRTDSAGIEQFVNNYCLQHPLDRLIRAGNALAKELLPTAQR